MIKALYNIAQKQSRKIVGLMSGTSMDGLDIALCTIKNSGKETEVIVDAFETIEYTAEFKNALRQLSNSHLDIEQLTLWNKHFGVYTAESILSFLKKHSIETSEVDLIASHGQTIFHAPMRRHKHEQFGNATLQIGDGDHIAALTGVVTLSDFRQKHIAKGGEGAPLAGYMDYLLYSSEHSDIVMLNIGGIANYSYLPHQPYKKMLCTDTGPGNALMDAWMHTYEGKPFDENGAFARKGKIIEPMLNYLCEHPFVSQTSPKTTGLEDFNLSILGTTHLNIFESTDVMATLNYFTAKTIAQNIKQNCGYEKMKIYCTGGGAHNSLLIEHLQKLLPNAQFHSTHRINIPSDAKEAVLFAVLANECVSGDPAVYENSGLPPVLMGKISMP